nr:hypothetical protein BaRGS_011833 [Batillaria attramentaria]
MVRCVGRARLISACPQPSVLSPQGPLVYGGKKIVREEVEERCQTPWEDAGDEDVLQMMPVTDSASGHHFTNVYCLLCHGGLLDNVQAWAISLQVSRNHDMELALTHSLPDHFRSADLITNVSTVSVNRTENGCLWNITAKVIVEVE